MDSRVELRRRKLFGPLLYGTLALFPLMLLGFGVWSAWPALRQALEVRSLARGLRDPDPLVSRRSADGLASAGEAAVPWLVEAARDRDPGLRLLAFSALHRTMPLPQEAIPALGDGLRDPDVRVRREVAAGLARFGPEAGGVSDDLTKALSDDDPEVRFRAAEALWRVQGRASEPVLRALLDLVAAPVATRPPDRIAVVGVLRRMGDEAEVRAIAALIPLIEPGTLPSGARRSSAWGHSALGHATPCRRWSGRSRMRIGSCAAWRPWPCRRSRGGARVGLARCSAGRSRARRCRPRCGSRCAGCSRRTWSPARRSRSRSTSCDRWSPNSGRRRPWRGSTPPSRPSPVPRCRNERDASSIRAAGVETMSAKRDCPSDRTRRRYA